MILSRINPYVADLLPNNQARFRPNRSTVDQVTQITIVVEDGFEHRRKSAAAFIDLTAAYDTVWHRGVRLKLMQSIPDRKMVSFIMETISNRRFTLYIPVMGKASRPKTLKMECLQGSILAPCLFNNYISNMPKTESQQFAYTDDLAILWCKPSLGSAETTMNNDLDTLYSHYHKNQLHLSLEKTSFTLFHLNTHETSRRLKIGHGKSSISYSETPKYLGVTFDRSLTYKQHLLSLCRKSRIKKCTFVKTCRDHLGHI